jgi:ABC-2 type transport system ATP-binding protein
MKVGEQLMYLAQHKGLKKDDAKARLKIWFQKLEMDGWWNKNVEDLSKGMQQKVQFISTVLHNPKLIILDEPFSGFDPVNANLIKDEILELNANGATIIFSTHRMESVEELCDHLVMIDKSRKILDGSLKSIKNEFRNQTYQIEHIGALNNGSNFEVVSQTTDADGMISSVIKTAKDMKTNIILSELITQTEVHAFQEKMPSINEIFINKVKEGKGELVSA